MRWALALSLDLQNVGINAMSGQFRASSGPMPDTQITRPAYFDPMQAVTRLPYLQVVNDDLGGPAGDLRTVVGPQPPPQ